MMWLYENHWPWPLVWNAPFLLSFIHFYFILSGLPRLEVEIRIYIWKGPQRRHMAEML
jgi:hypothetical protein